MEKIYWENYYEINKEPIKNSPFAKFVSTYIQEGKTLIELGCGNGRDSIYFSKLNLNILGVDQCENEIKYLEQKYSSQNLSFKVGDFTNMSINKKYDYVYSRFTLHSVNEDAEDRVLNWAYNSINENGKLFLEVRSTKDDMFSKGAKISKNETITDHYRRFSDFEKLKEKINEIGFSIDYAIESKGLAKHINEDPEVIRIIAIK